MMEGEEFNLHWEEEVEVKHSPDVVEEEVICGLDTHNDSYSNAAGDMIEENDQMAAENLMYLSQDVVSYTETAEVAADPNVECVTEEVITDDWVIPGWQERVEVPVENLTYPMQDIKEGNDIDVPLPTDQDEYMATRPWPCDFCSRRFRKKAALMNHMVAHQNDRPHACNLCGVRYVRKCDLMNHLKVHAFVPDNHDTLDYEEMLETNQITKPKKKRGRRKKNSESVQNGMWENMTSARTQQWSRRARTPPKPVTPPSPATPSPPPSPPPPPADPSRPFVCRHCGVGFAREKALQSHARVHGGDSPVECGECGELCWSREALHAHAAQRHPHLPRPRARDTHTPYHDSDADDDMEFRLSPETHAGSTSGERVFDSVRGPELFCQDCGVAFQRADLLRRHVAAAHSYKRHDSSSSTWGEHTCDVCGEVCPDALQLLAHAEGHAERHTHLTTRLKKSSRGRNNLSSSSNSRQFPCRECGKVFGSRSSQQIHIRIHTGERPYACRFCWKAFADGGTLRKHERIHTGEKPYACAVCPRAFNQRVVLREHVRSHHSAPDRRANGGPAYCCVVCGRTLHSSAELVQHLIQHCDANTALKRQPQTGPRKYKRRRKIKEEGSPSRASWERGSASPALASRSASPASPTRDVTPPPRDVTPPRRRRRRAPPPPPPPRPRMIHTEDPRPRTKQVRQRRPPRHPADDLRAIKPRPQPRRSAPSPPTPASPTSSMSPVSTPTTSPVATPTASPVATIKASPVATIKASPVATIKASPVATIKASPVVTPTGSPAATPPASPTLADTSGPHKCEMCSLEFLTRDALLFHVPVHI